MPKKKHNAYIIFAIVALAGIILILSSIDIGVGIVRNQAVKAADDMLSADLMIDKVGGNPFRGYKIDGVRLIRGGRTLLTFKEITVKPKLFSLLSGGLKMSLVGIKGFNSDVDDINAVIGSLKLGDGGGENPIEKLRITDSTIGSKWADGKIGNLLLAFSGNDIDADLDLSLNDLPLKGVLDITRDGSSLAVRKMDVNVGKGKISAIGSILPELSIKGKIDDIDIQRLVSFWPDVKRASYEGSFSGSFEASGSWENPDISGTLSYSGKKIAGFPISRGSSKWRYSNYRLDVNDLSADPIGVPVEGGIAFAFGKTAPRMFVDLGAKSVNLASLKDFSPKLENIGGVVDEVKIKLQGNVTEPDGRIDLKAKKLNLMGYAVENTDIGIRISKGNMTVSGKSEYEKAPLGFSGTLSSFMTSPVFDVRGSLRSLRLESLRSLLPALEKFKAEGSLNGDIRISGKADSPAVSGKIWSEKLGIMGESLSAPSALFRFGDGTLSLSGVKTSWRGAGISGEGTVSGLLAKSGNMDMRVEASGVDSSLLENFVPALSTYPLRGKVSAAVSLKGEPTNPAVDLEVGSDSMVVMDKYRFGGLKVSTSLPGIPKTVPESFALAISSSSANLAGIPVGNIALKIDKKENSVNISRGEATLGKGTLSASGKIMLGAGGKSPDLDVHLAASSVELGSLSSAFKGMPDVKGLVTGDISVKGPLSGPSFAFTGSSPSIRASGMEIEDLSASIGGDMELVKIDKLTAKAGGGTMDISGQIRPEAADADISVKGTALDLAVLTAGFPKAKEFGVGGNVDLDFSGHFGGKANSGSGLLSSKEARVMGIRVKDISCPLSLKGNMLSAADGKAALYGGGVKADGSLDLNTLKFDSKAEADGIDVDAMMKDAFGLSGHITGNAQVFAKLSGSMAGGLSYSGNGLLKVGEGAISDFKGVTLVAALYGLKSIRYESVYAPFDIGTGYIDLGDKTKVSAYASDPLYEYFEAEGRVGPDSKLDLLCNGSLNIQIVNMLLGGVAGGLTAEKSIGGLLKGVIQGAGQQAGKDDFRSVSFKLGGTFDKPRISGAKVESASQTQTTGEVEKKAVESTRETSSDEDSETVQDQSIEDQIKDKILKNIFR